MTSRFFRNFIYLDIKQQMQVYPLRMNLRLATDMINGRFADLQAHVVSACQEFPAGSVRCQASAKAVAMVEPDQGCLVVAYWVRAFREEL